MKRLSQKTLSRRWRPGERQLDTASVIGALAVGVAGPLAGVDIAS